MAERRKTLYGPDDRQASSASAMRWAHKVTSIGFELVIPIAGGVWLDQKYQTKPWLMILGVMLGMFLGFQGLMRLVHELDQSKKAKETDRQQPK